MYAVYLIQSLSSPAKRYVGITQDLENRLVQHDAGYVASTKPYTPWQLKVSISFQEHAKAKAFEQYLKHGSGHAFAKRHFW